MFKRILVLVLCLCMVICAFASCGDTTAEGSSVAEVSSEEPKKVFNFEPKGVFDFNTAEAEYPFVNDISGYKIAKDPEKIAALEFDLKNMTEAGVLVHTNPEMFLLEEGGKYKVTFKLSSETGITDNLSIYAMMKKDIVPAREPISDPNPYEGPKVIELVWDSANGQYKIPDGVVVYTGDTLKFDPSREIYVKEAGKAVKISSGRLGIHYDKNNDGALDYNSMDSQGSMSDKNNAGLINGEITIPRADAYWSQVRFFDYNAGVNGWIKDFNAIDPPYEKKDKEPIKFNETALTVAADETKEVEVIIDVNRGFFGDLVIVLEGGATEADTETKFKIDDFCVELIEE